MGPMLGGWGVAVQVLEEYSLERDKAWSCVSCGLWQGKEHSLLPGCKIVSSKSGPDSSEEG